MAGSGRFGGRRPEAAPPPSGDVPPAIVDAAKAAFRQRTSGELASLAFDSAVDEGAERGDRLLRFEYASGRIELVVSRGASGHTVGGRAEPSARQAILEIEGAEVAMGEEVHSAAFAFHNVPSGIIRVIVLGSLPSDRVHTDWVRI